MRFVYPAAGLAILLLLSVDLVRTGFGEGGGPLARRLAEGLRAAFLLRPGRRAPGRGASWVGLATLLTIVLLWFSLLWAGWYLVLEGAAILDPGSGVAATGIQRMQVAAFAMFGLGAGPYQLVGSWWLASPVAASSSVLVAVLALAWIVAVLRAAAHRRWVAALVSGLGASPQDILLRAWGGLGFDGLEHHLPALARELASVQQSQRANPVLHAFPGSRVDEAAAVQIARLDEALTLLDLGVESHLELESVGAGPARELISGTLRALPPEGRGRAPPPPPTLERLRAGGVPVVPDEVFAWRIQALGERRRALRAFVEAEGWRWDDVARISPRRGSSRP